MPVPHFHSFYFSHFSPNIAHLVYSQGSYWHQGRLGKNSLLYPHFTIRQLYNHVGRHQVFWETFPPRWLVLAQGRQIVHYCSATIVKNLTRPNNIIFQWTIIAKQNNNNYTKPYIATSHCRRQIKGSEITMCKLNWYHFRQWTLSVISWGQHLMWVVSSVYILWNDKHHDIIYYWKYC